MAKQTLSRFLPHAALTAAIAAAAVIGTGSLTAAPAAAQASTPPAAPATPARAMPAPAAPARPAPAPLATPAVAPAAAPALVVPDPLSLPSMSLGVLRGFTKPSGQSDLYFQLPGVVREVKIKLGDKVKAGDLLAVQDVIEDIAAIEVKKGEVTNAALQVRVAEVDLEQKKVELGRVEGLYNELIAQGKSNSEVDKARVDVKIGEVAVEFRKGEWDLKKLEVKQLEIRRDQKKLLSPIDGIVAKADIHPGEGSDIQRSTNILIVKNDPLYVEVNVPTDRALALKEGDMLQVKYVDGGDWMPARIMARSALANPGANVRLVRLQMPNTAQREAGVQVLVKLPENVAAAPAPVAPGIAQPAAAARAAGQ